MPPQKPTGKGAPRRADASKSASNESSVPADESGAPIDLPSDFAALATILEAAMSSESAARAFDRKPPMPRAPARETAAHSPSAFDRAPAATDLPAPTAVQPSTSVTAFEAAAFDEVARSLAAAENCVPLLAQSTGLMRLAALDVVKAETSRAGALLQLLRFLRGEVTPGRLSASSGKVVERVVQAVESERRLRGIVLVTSSDVSDATCTGDESLLTSVLMALLICTYGLVEGIPSARVTLSVRIASDGGVVFSVSQNHVAAPELWRVRTTGNEFATDAGGIVCAVAMSAAFTVAWKWGGDFSVAAPEHASALTLTLPPLRRSTDQQPHH